MWARCSRGSGRLPGRPQGWQPAEALPVLWLHWSPQSARAQPVLTLWAVPSPIRSLIRQAIHDQVPSEAAERFAEITSTDVSRADIHDTRWMWSEGGLSRGESERRGSR